MSADLAAVLGLPPGEDRPRRRRGRGGAWLVVLVIVAVLLAAAAVGAEFIARGVVTGGVRTLVASQVQVPPGQDVDVEVAGAVVPQLIAGRLDVVTVSAPDATVGPLTGDVTVIARGVPLRADSPADGGTATVRLDQDQLRRLLAQIDGFPAQTVGLAAPDVTISNELSLLGVGVPVGVSLAPGADGGRVTLSPTAFRVAGVQADADAVRAQFGGLADAVLRTWSICIAGDVPQALRLASAAVDGADLVATFDIDGRVLVDPSLLQDGTCG